ncbi:Hypothetical protein NTJ_00848 [Nesidiocoris tenuis]|uniref:Uncharacterized protein n=1 Tax=Nesidiocoris tenuis TaxID=355587 RepID=A0ABN7ACQ4_9HEMI|nr:Hypothetical protein NTJ_00848 [Nesidiocoris tenuis]
MTCSRDALTNTRRARESPPYDISPLVLWSGANTNSTVPDKDRDQSWTVGLAEGATVMQFHGRDKIKNLVNTRRERTRLDSNCYSSW